MTMQAESQRLYSIEDAARALGGISAWTIRKHLDRGTVQATRIGRRVFLSAEEVSRIEKEGLPPLRAEASG